ncbi:MAG: type II toxin-antitoxin system VapC family toxin [Mycobacteriales bacterium]
MIVIDASVLIAHLDADDAAHASAQQLLLSAAGSPFGTSPITMAEVLVGPTRAGRVSEAATALEELGIETFPLPPDAPTRLAALRATTSLKLPDCCVLLTAEQRGATGIATFDRRLAARAHELGFTVAQ